MKDGKRTVVRTVPLEYQTVLACPANIGGEDVAACTKAYTSCDGMPNATGPLVRIRFRTVLPANAHGDWQAGGETCYPNLVPNTIDKPRLTLAMIQSEFDRTPFTAPVIRIEPVGNRTLVNLPTYFTATFPAGGYGPGQVRTTTLLGHTVRIRPVFHTTTITLGDGTTLGPATSTGGGYPGGDLVHTYTHPGTVTTRATVVYSGQFSVDDQDWANLPGTATITGPAQALQVLQATNRLVR
ncbi:hypothetical protein [Rudaeicoccus suwonensis]|uniref:hypothetical protein n=1 Tax=Rudaeicoccus suwonensis TaxID=657409 RepID=UPI0011A19FD3|nr:hypothetical protein [Rudaeicoccus suwonensis]